MKERLLYLLVVVGSSLYLVNCDETEVQPTPIISGFVPASGFAGDNVTVTGSHFIEDISKVEIQFNGVSAEIISSTATAITVKVPQGGSTGKISVSIRGKVASSANDFTFFEPSSIASFNPPSGNSPYNGIAGTEITIQGANFNSTPSDNIVKFGNTTAVVTAATQTQIITRVPEGAITGKISVTVNGRTVESANDFVVHQPPSISTVIPASGNAGYNEVSGTTVTITGTNFSLVPEENTVKFGNVSAVVTAATTTQLITTVPQGASSGKVSVTVHDLLTESAGNFTVLTQPILNSISPLHGVPGSTITIRGINFSTTAANNIVTFNGISAAVTQANPIELRVTVPNAATTGRIAINIASESVTSTVDFQVLKDIPRQGLLAFYPFTGNSNDASGNNKNLTAQAATNTPSSSTDRFGKSGQAFTFDGVDDALFASEITITHPVTYSFWETHGALDNTGGIIGSKSGTTNGFAMQNSLNSFILYVDGNIAYSTGNVMPTSTNGEWSCYTITYDGSIVNVYRNGTLVSTKGPTAGVITSTGFLIIGRSQNGGAYAGSIDDVAVYNRVLTDVEVLQLYEQTASKF